MKNAATIVTAFPDSAYARHNGLTRENYRAVDIRQQAFQALEEEYMEQVWKSGRIEVIKATDVAAKIISTALFGMLSFRKDWELNFMELFREALGQITERHSSLFRQYATSISSQGRRSVEEVEINDVLIRAGKMEQIHLSLEVADVIDELNMLKKLFWEQREVLRRASRQVEEVSIRMKQVWRILSFGKSLGELSSKLGDYLFQVESMTEDGERAQKDILRFLDLQQREENIHEAQENARQAKENVRQTTSLNQQALFAAKQAISAQEQADATGAQNQILFISPSSPSFFYRFRSSPRTTA